MNIDFVKVPFKQSFDAKYEGPIVKKFPSDFYLEKNVLGDKDLYNLNYLKNHRF